MCQQDITAEYEEKDVQMPYSLLSGFFFDFVVFFPSIPRPSRLFSLSGFACIKRFQRPFITASWREAISASCMGGHASDRLFGFSVPRIKRHRHLLLYLIPELSTKMQYNVNIFLIFVRPIGLWCVSE
jgi:hypothetical protein